MSLIGLQIQSWTGNFELNSFTDEDIRKSSYLKIKVILKSPYEWKVIYKISDFLLLESATHLKENIIIVIIIIYIWKIKYNILVI